MQLEPPKHEAFRAPARHAPTWGGAHTATSRPTTGGGHAPTQHAPPWGGPRTSTIGPAMRGGHAPTQHQPRLGKQHKRNRNPTADQSHPNTPTKRRRKRRRTNNTSRAWRRPKHHQPEPNNARRQATQTTTTKAKHQQAKTTAGQHNGPGTPRSQQNETHAQQAALNKTQTTTTQRNRLRTCGPSHGAPNSEHGVYTAPDNNGQRNTTRRTLADPGTTNQHRNRHDNYTNNIRPRKRLLQHQGTNAEQADHEAAETSVRQQNCCSSHDMTINRPRASRPTPN